MRELAMKNHMPFFDETLSKVFPMDKDKRVRQGMPTDFAFDMDKENFDDFNEKGEPMKPGESFFGKPILPK